MVLPREVPAPARFVERLLGPVARFPVDGLFGRLGIDRLGVRLLRILVEPDLEGLDRITLGLIRAERPPPPRPPPRWASASSEVASPIKSITKSTRAVRIRLVFTDLFIV